MALASEHRQMHPPRQLPGEQRGLHRRQGVPRHDASAWSPTAWAARQAGEVASKRAIEILPRELKKHLAAPLGNDETKNIIRRSIVQANEEIMAMAALDRELKNMGTTVVLTVWRKGVVGPLRQPAWATAAAT